MLNSLLLDNDDGYAWEGAYEQTWAAVREDASGRLHATTDDSAYKLRKKNLQEKQKTIRLSMMRNAYLVVDLSSCMIEKDLKPSRVICTMRLLQKFIFNYFDQNPISQLGVIITRNKSAEKLTELLGNPKRVVDKLKGMSEKHCGGEPSLQNSLEIALASLKGVKSHCSKEIIFVMGSLTTCDPSDVYVTLNECKTENVRCSFIGLTAEVFIFKHLCEVTRGLYWVIMDEVHFSDILKQIALPLPSNDTNTETLIRMGFPKHKILKQEDASMCMCHLSTEKAGLSTGGYFCPQCDSKYCEIPVECKACGLTLVCAPHLARSYHHLFPLAFYDELVVQEAINEVNDCYGCQFDLKTDTNYYECKDCKKHFCSECDLFIHETIHSCPGCCQIPTKSQKSSLQD